jgi:integrase
VRRPLAKLSTAVIAAHFQKLIAYRNPTTGRELSRATISRVQRVLRARLEAAVRLGKLRRNPMTGEASDMIPVDGARPRAKATLTFEQVGAVIVVAHRHRFGAFFAALAWCGARPSELAGSNGPEWTSTPAR